MHVNTLCNEQLCNNRLNPHAKPFLSNLRLNPLATPFNRSNHVAPISTMKHDAKSISSASPCPQNLSTPACSDQSNIADKSGDSDGGESPDSSMFLNPNVDISNEQMASVSENAVQVLNKIRKKYVKNVLIGHLNINTLANKFEALTLIIKDRLDILVLVETKLDDSFTEKQFYIEGYTKPYRVDRNCDGGGILIYVRKDIPSKELKKHNFTKNIEALFVEINLRKNKFLLVGTYHSTHPEYGTSDNDYFEQIGFSLDVYSNYDRFLLAGDFNVQIGESSIDDFLTAYGANNLVKDFTCFKSLTNPSCIDLFLTNSSNSFQSTTTVSTGLSDFHKMIITVLKTTFPKSKPKVLLYRDYSKFENENFRKDLKAKLQNPIVKDYESFEKAYLNVLNTHAPFKKKMIRANNKPYVTKQLRKAIMRRSYLENKFYKNRSAENSQAYKKQKNYCNRLYKRERRKFYSHLNLKNITDNKKFWSTVNPFFSNKGGSKDNIVLVNGDNIISDDIQVAQTFNDIFKNCVNSLNISENKLLLTEITNVLGCVDESIERFENHPSIRSINENVEVDHRFSFSEVNVNDIRQEIKNLNGKKLAHL